MDTELPDVSAGDVRPPTRTQCESIADAVQAHGATHLFGLMGDGNMRAISAVAGRGVEIVQVRHESAAVAMAQGYGWSSGRAGIASVTHGPGLTHTATSLVAAARDRAPLVLLAGEAQAGAQAIDQARFVHACESVYWSAGPEDDAGAVVADALEWTTRYRVPVVVGLRPRLMDEPVPAQPSPRRSFPPADEPTVEDDALAAAAIVDAIGTASRPVLLAGRGASGSEAAQLLVRLAELTGAALSTTLPAKGLFDGHPNDIGVCGGLAHPEAERVLGAADLIVAFGASVGPLTRRTLGGPEHALFPRARVLRVDARRVEDSASEVVFGEAHASLRLALDRLRFADLRRDPWFPTPNPWPECWREELEGYRPTTRPGTIDPRQAMVDLDPLLPDDAVLVIANGHSSGFSAGLLRGTRPRSICLAQGFASVGLGLPTAIGVALGAPGRRVVAFEGDAGFMMHAQELETAVRAGVRLTIFVLNDEALGSEFHRAHSETERVLAEIPARGITGIGTAVGALAIRVRVAADVRSATEQVLGAPVGLAELLISREVESRHERA